MHDFHGELKNMKVYNLRPFPEKAAEQNSLFQNWKLKLPLYQTQLGLSAADIARQAADADIFNYILNYKTYLKDSVSAYSSWQRSMLKGDVNASPTPPVFEPVTLPEAHFGGILVRGRQLDQRMKKAAGFTEQIGEDLGMVEFPTPPSPESFTAKITLTAMMNGNVSAKFVKRHFQAIRLEWKLASETEWRYAGIFTASPAIHPAEGDARFVPQIRQYRGIMINKNVAVGHYSPIMTIVTTP